MPKLRRLSHVQLQCTIALVSDAQTEGSVSVTPEQNAEFATLAAL